jgi:hypothetical protein
VGVEVEGVIEVKEAFQAARNVRKQGKNGRFLTLFYSKIAANAVFSLKVLTNYTPEMFFKEDINVKNSVT